MEEAVSTIPGEEGKDDTLGKWQEPRPRGCCIVVPIGCLLSVMLILLFSGLAVAQPF